MLTFKNNRMKIVAGIVIGMFITMCLVLAHDHFRSKQKTPEILSKGDTLKAPIATDTMLVKAPITPNYDSLFVRGKKYILIDRFAEENNPFKPEKKLKYVTIVKKKDGFVQYCYTSDLKKEDIFRSYFTRSYLDFSDLMATPDEVKAYGK